MTRRAQCVTLMGVVNGTHQPIIIWHCRLKARIVAPQVTDEMAEFSSVTKEEQSSYTTDVRSADLKANTTDGQGFGV